PLVIAELAEPSAPQEEPPPVLVADSGSEVPTGGVDVQLAPPAVPPEPPRWTGIAMETADVTPRKLPDGFRPRPGVGVHASGWPLEITCDHDGAAMVLVPAGTFIMGRDDG